MQPTRQCARLASLTPILKPVCFPQFLRYGYKDDTLCTECGGNLALAFIPLIVIIVLALIAAVAMLKGGSSAFSLETLVEGGAQAAIQEAMEAKGDGVLAAVNEQKGKVLSPTCLKIASYAKKAVAILQKADVKTKILLSLWQVLVGLGATFSIPFPVRVRAPIQR